jgi:diamine N-acetyltransferase
VPEPVTLCEITDGNRDSVLRLRVAPGQERFVGSVAGALEEAAEFGFAKPWYRAVYAGDVPVGFIMLSWDVEPDPPELIGPWFLWKLIIDQHHQRCGFGRAAVAAVAELVRTEGAVELLTSYTEGDGEPWPFYRALGFVATGERDVNGEVILRLVL